MQPAIETTAPNQVIYQIQQVQPGEWVAKPIIKMMFGYTEDLLKKYRSQYWLEGKQYKKNPANTIVYNVEEVNRWSKGY